MSSHNGLRGPTEPKPKHRRDPDGHREDILEAARHTFAERGYTRTTLREIARRAGVTHGLITQQFTSKERLFLAAVSGNNDLEHVAVGDPAALPDRIAHAFVQRMETNALTDPLVTLIRSAASDELAATQLLAAMQENSSNIYRSAIPPRESAASDDDLNHRVALAESQMIGITFSRYIAKTEPLASMSPELLTRHFARILQHTLFD